MSLEDPLQHEKRFAPRFPLPQEEIRFHLSDHQRAFALRDLSLTGVAVGLLEHGEMLLFPEDSICLADLKLGEMPPFTVELEVVRRNAYSVAFRFLNIDEKTLQQLKSFLDPLLYGKSLRPVDIALTPKALAEGITKWFHGKNSTDLYLWQDERGGATKILLCLGEHFLEWRDGEGVRTGGFERTEAEEAVFTYDREINNEVLQTARKVLENAEVLDYRLVEFIQRELANPAK